MAHQSSGNLFEQQASLGLGDDDLADHSLHSPFMYPSLGESGWHTKDTGLEFKDNLLMINGHYLPPPHDTSTTFRHEADHPSGMDHLFVDVHRTSVNSAFLADGERPFNSPFDSFMGMSLHHPPDECISSPHQWPYKPSPLPHDETFQSSGNVDLSSYLLPLLSPAMTPSAAFQPQNPSSSTLDQWPSSQSSGSSLATDTKGKGSTKLEQFTPLSSPAMGPSRSTSSSDVKEMIVLPQSISRSRAEPSYPYAVRSSSRRRSLRSALVPSAQSLTNGTGHEDNSSISAPFSQEQSKQDQAPSSMYHEASEFSLNSHIYPVTPAQLLNLHGMSSVHQQLNSAARYSAAAPSTCNSESLLTKDQHQYQQILHRLTKTREDSTKTQTMPLDDDEKSEVGEDGGDLPKREQHKVAEKRRRDVLKNHFAALKDLLPPFKEKHPSKMIVLEQAVEYVRHLHAQRDEQERLIQQLQRDLECAKQG